VGVLTKGDKDDGRGSARLKVMNYKHEQMSGRTSSMATEIMGFRDNGEQVLPDRFQPCKNKFWKEVVEGGSTKMVSFVDLCGHEKYLKTTIHGLVSMLPDYSMIIVGANMGVSKMTREHLGISLFL
jgi:GTPase